MPHRPSQAGNITKDLVIYTFTPERYIVTQGGRLVCLEFRHGSDDLSAVLGTNGSVDPFR